MNKTCKNCQFNFDGICAAHDRYYDYGNKIFDFNVTCDEWDIAFSHFQRLCEKHKGNHIVQDYMHNQCSKYTFKDVMKIFGLQY